MISPKPHGTASVLRDDGDGFLVVVGPDGHAYDVIRREDRCTLSRRDNEQIGDGWFCIVQAIKNAVYGPESALLMTWPTESMLRDNLNQYHFRVLTGEDAAAASWYGDGRNVAWEAE